MTYDKQALTDLMAKIEAGDDAGFRKANRTVFSTPCQDMALQLREEHSRHAYKGSLDAAKALHEAVLGGWGWRFDEHYGDGMPAKFERKTAWVSMPDNWRVGHTSLVKDNNPARAWLIATIKALIAECDV